MDKDGVANALPLDHDCDHHQEADHLERVSAEDCDAERAIMHEDVVNQAHNSQRSSTDTGQDSSIAITSQSIERTEAHSESDPSHILRLTTIELSDQETAKSETSSVVPTSARLSIATTTHPFANAQQGNTESIGQMLDGILSNPGWSVGAQERGTRRNSLFSMRSLQPTLPPYEEYRNHILVSSTEAGPANPRPDRVSAQVTGNQKQRDVVQCMAGDENSTTGLETRSLDSDDDDNDPGNAIAAHYSRIVRTIDSRYTSEIERAQANHAQELARMRNDLDASYRAEFRQNSRKVERAREEAASRSEELEQCVQEWKEKSEQKIQRIEEKAREGEERSRKEYERDIERLMNENERDKERLRIEYERDKERWRDEYEREKERLRNEYERDKERAKHEVEDVWERRWRDRMGLDEDEGKRRVRKRDEEWLAFLLRKYPDILDVARIEMRATSEF